MIYFAYFLLLLAALPALHWVLLRAPKGRWGILPYFLVGFVPALALRAMTGVKITAGQLPGAAVAIVAALAVYNRYFAIPFARRWGK